MAVIAALLLVVCVLIASLGADRKAMTEAFELTTKAADALCEAVSRAEESNTVISTLLTTHFDILQRLEARMTGPAEAAEKSRHIH
jgi:hypothetical protein